MHLDFSDDVMVFFDGSHTSLSELTATWEVFHRISGPEMIREKYALYTARIDVDEQDSLTVFGFTKGFFLFGTWVF